MITITEVVENNPFLVQGFLVTLRPAYMELDRVYPVQVRSITYQCSKPEEGVIEVRSPYIEPVRFSYQLDETAFLEELREKLLEKGFDEDESWKHNIAKGIGGVPFAVEPINGYDGGFVYWEREPDSNVPFTRVWVRETFDGFSVTYKSLETSQGIKEEYRALFARDGTELNRAARRVLERIESLPEPPRKGRNHADLIEEMRRASIRGPSE